MNQISQIADRPAFIKSVIYTGRPPGLVIGIDDQKIHSPYWWAVGLDRRLYTEAAKKEPGIRARQLAAEATREFLPGGLLHNFVRKAYEVVHRQTVAVEENPVSTIADVVTKIDTDLELYPDPEKDLARRELYIAFEIRLLLECLVPDPDDMEFADLLSEIDESLVDCGSAMILFDYFEDYQTVDRLELDLEPLFDPGVWWGWLTKYESQPLIRFIHLFLNRIDYD